MIEFKNVTKVVDYQGMKMKSLEGISFSVNAQQIFGIVGDYACGKTTLLKSINGLEKATEGEVLVMGKNINKLSTFELRTLRKRIGCVFQGLQLFPSYNVFDNIAFPLRLSKISEKDVQSRVRELLEYVELTDKATDYPVELSASQKQRAVIARAISTNPHILLCDEPTAELDPITTRRILTLLKRLRDECHLTIVITSNEMNAMKTICDGFLVLDNGRMAPMKVPDSSSVRRLGL